MKLDKFKFYKKPTFKQHFFNVIKKVSHQQNNINFKQLFIIENIILLVVIVSIVIYEYYILDRTALNLTTQNKLTATSIIINLLMSIF